MGGVLLILPWSFFFLKRTIDVMEERKELYPESNLPSISDFSIALYATAILIILRVTSGYFIFKPLGQLVLPEKWDYKERMNRIDRFSAVAFKFFYFIVLSFWGWRLLKDEIWFPPALGGTGSVRNVWKD